VGNSCECKIRIWKDVDKSESNSVPFKPHGSRAFPLVAENDSRTLLANSLAASLAGMTHARVLDADATTLRSTPLHSALARGFDPRWVGNPCECKIRIWEDVDKSESNSIPFKPHGSRAFPLVAENDSRMLLANSLAASLAGMTHARVLDADATTLRSTPLRSRSASETDSGIVDQVRLHLTSPIPSFQSHPLSPFSHLFSSRV
jgi:hypothetical protein